MGAGLNRAAKFGLLKIGGDGITVNVRGSHIMLHGKQQTHTIVRQHRSSTPLSGQKFVESIRHFISTGRPVGGDSGSR